MIGFSVIAWIGCAIGAGAVAGSKGRSALGYFVLGLFLPFIGLLIAIGVSDNRKAAPPAVVAVPATQDKHIGEKKCPSCAEWIKTEALKCRYCGEAQAQLSRVALPPAIMGTCPGCGKLRADSVAACVYCGNTEPVTV